MVSCACTLYTYICWQATVAITATIERVYIRLYKFEMPPLIENPADCELRSVIRYLSAKGVKAVEIHRNICEVYGRNMSDEMVKMEDNAMTTTIASRQPCCSGHHIRRQISMMKV